MDILVVFINEIERQLYKKVKVVRSNRGGGKLDENGQCPYLFAKFLEIWGICAQYKMPSTPHEIV